MKNTVQHRAFRGTLAGGVALGCNLVLTVLQVPALLHFWDAATYGVWLTFFSLAGILTTLDLGHQEYLASVFNRLNVESADRLRDALASGVLGALLLAVTEFFVGGALITSVPLNRIFGGDLSEAFVSEIRYAAFTYLCYWVVFGSIGGVISRLYGPRGYYARATVFAIVMRIAQFAGLLAAAALSKSIVVAMFCYCGVSGIVSIAILLDARRLFPDLILGQRGHARLPEALQNLRRSLYVTGNSLLDQASLNGLTLVVANRLGLEAVPLFNTLRTVSNVVIQGATATVAPLGPELARYYHKKEPQKLQAMLSTTWFASTTLVHVAALALAVITPLFYGWWTRHELPYNRTLFHLLCLGVCARCCVAGSTMFLVSVNDIRAQLATTTLRAGLILAVCAAAAPWLGVAAAGLAVVLGEAAAAFGPVTFFTKKSIQGLGGHFDWRSLTLSAASFGVVCLALSCTLLTPTVYPGLLAVFPIGLIATLQWRQLPPEVRQRLSRQLNSLAGRNNQISPHES